MTEPERDLGSYAHMFVKGFKTSMTVRRSFDLGTACQGVVDRTSVTVPGGDLRSYAHKSVKGLLSNLDDGAQIFRSRYGMSRGR
jgi:hypothetical protein